MTALPIVIPPGFISVVTVGQAIAVGDPLAKSLPQTDASINIAKVLQVSLKQMKHVLKKNPGEGIEPDDILAQKKSLFGIRDIVIRSKTSGTVLRYERTTGNLIIRINDGNPIVQEELVSPVE